MEVRVHLDDLSKLVQISLCCITQIWNGQIKVLRLHGTPAGHKNKSSVQKGSMKSQFINLCSPIQCVLQYFCYLANDSYSVKMNGINC